MSYLKTNLISSGLTNESPIEIIRSGYDVRDDVKTMFERVNFPTLFLLHQGL